MESHAYVVLLSVLHEKCKKNRRNRQRRQRFHRIKTSGITLHQLCFLHGSRLMLVPMQLRPNRVQDPLRRKIEPRRHFHAPHGLGMSLFLHDRVASFAQTRACNGVDDIVDASVRGLETA